MVLSLLPLQCGTAAVTATFQSLIEAPDAETDDWFGGGIAQTAEFLIVGAEKESEAALEAGAFRFAGLN